MHNLSEGVSRWLTIATEEQLKTKLEEYAGERRELSPRDVETRARLANAIRAELGRRLSAGKAPQAGEDR